MKKLRQYWWRDFKIYSAEAAVEYGLIDESVISGESEPLLVYEAENKTAALCAE